MNDLGSTERIVVLLVTNTVPILTAMAALVAAVGAVLALLKGRQNEQRLTVVQEASVVAASKADTAANNAERAATKATELHGAVNGRMDQLMGEVRAEARRMIAEAEHNAQTMIDAIRKEADRAVAHAQRNAEQRIAAFQLGAALDRADKAPGSPPAPGEG